MNVRCDYCGKPARFVDSAIVHHGVSYGMIWYCRDCGAWVGCRKGTQKPLGRLANAELRRWKRQAHKAFDPFWENKERQTRDAAYKWMAEEMGLPTEKAHIGMFDVEQCKRIIAICDAARRRRGGAPRISDSSRATRAERG